MKFIFAHTIYTKKFGVEFGTDAAFAYNNFYKFLIWIWIWNRVLAIFLIKDKKRKIDL